LLKLTLRARSSSRGDVDVVDTDAEAADRLAVLHLADHLAGDLGVGHEHRICVARDGEDAVGRRFGRHFQLRVDAGQRLLGGIKAGERGIGNGDKRPTHFASLPD
jgi:hypothetical protein